MSCIVMILRLYQLPLLGLYSVLIIHDLMMLPKYSRLW